MEDNSSLPASPTAVIAPPRRGRKAHRLALDAVTIIGLLGLLPLAVTVTQLAVRTQRHQLPANTRRRGKPHTYSEASIMLIALIARLWQLSEREVCDWLER